MDITLNVIYTNSQIVSSGKHSRTRVREFTARHTVDIDSIYSVRERVDKIGINSASCVVIMDDSSELIVNEPFESVYNRVYGRKKVGFKQSK